MRPFFVSPQERWLFAMLPLWATLAGSCFAALGGTAIKTRIKSLFTTEHTEAQRQTAFSSVNSVTSVVNTHLKVRLSHGQRCSQGAKCPLDAQCIQFSQQVFVVGLGLELVHHLHQLAILANNERGADQAHELLAHEFLHAPAAIFFRHGMVFI